MGFIKKFIIFCILVLLAGGAGLFLWISSIPIPDFQSFDERRVIQSTKIYDRTGKILLYDVHKNVKRNVIPYEEIPRQIKNATVAIEDENFYQHGGISIPSVIRAFFVNLGAGEIEQGGSTITQQLVKNSLLTSEKKITRKIKELFLALKIEKSFSKEEILTFYLNEIPYGGSNYGIEAASQSFFGKNTKDLTLAESAYLAALPQAPTFYSPYGNHREELDKRKNLVLGQMLKLGFIEENEYEQAKNEKATFLSQSEKGIRAPHFVLYIKNYLENKYGKEAVEQGGLKVTTTIDIELQEEAEKMVKDYIDEIEQKFNAYNASMTGIDPKTGQILVMVGSRDWHAESLPEGCTPGSDCKFEPQLNAGTYDKGRQPGSSFKPFVYATALEKGYTAETVVFDLKTEFNSSCNPDGTPKPGTKEDECYMPENYDGIFRGHVTFRDALAQSINIPAVKVLYLAGLNNSLNTARNMGISTLSDASRYGLTLVLGGGEVTLLEMTGAYSVFANEGIKNPLTGILKIEDGNGKILEEFKKQEQEVLSKDISQTITNILSDNDARSPAFGEQSWLYFPEREVAVKTGTTNNYRDAWVIGYTPNFTLGLWIGNNDNSEMEKRVAGFIAAPLWNSFFKKVFEKIPKEDFAKENIIKPTNDMKPVLRGYWQGSITYYVDKISEKLMTQFTPIELREEKFLTQAHSILYWLNKDEPNGERPAHPEEDSQFALWEKPVRDWAQNQNIIEQTEEDMPKEYDDIHKPEYAPQIQIISPQPKTTLSPNEKITLTISDQSHFLLDYIDVYLNDTYLGHLRAPLIQTVFNLDGLPTTKESILKLIVYDKVKNKSEYNIPLIFR